MASLSNESRNKMEKLISGVIMSLDIEEPVLITHICNVITKYCLVFDFTHLCDQSGIHKVSQSIQRMRNTDVSFIEHQKCVGILNFYLTSDIFNVQEQTPQPPVVGAPAVSSTQTPQPPVVGAPAVSSTQTPQPPVVGAPAVSSEETLPEPAEVVHPESNGQTPQPPAEVVHPESNGQTPPAPAEVVHPEASEQTPPASDVVTSSNQTQTTNPLINGNVSGNGIIVITTNDNILSFLREIIQRM